MGEDASKLHIVLVKSNPQPLTIDNIEWQMVAAIPAEQVPSIKNTIVIGSKRMVCTVDAAGSFVLLSLDGEGFSLRYDPPLVVNTTFSTHAKWSNVDGWFNMDWDENAFALFNIPQPASKRFQVYSGSISNDNEVIYFDVLNSTLQRFEIIPQRWNL
ncbi:hypothetical protein BGW41_004545, partial [Actinomortierella wolfii]